MATALEQIFWCPEALAAPRSPDFGVADLYLNFIKQNRQIDFVVRKPVLRYKAGQRCEFVQFGEGIEIMSTLIPVFFQTQRIGQRSWVEIKEKWKTDVRKLTIGMETQAELNIIKERKKKTTA